MNINFSKHIVIIFIFISSISTINAQLGVGVPVPHSSSILEASSSTKGALLPRMTTAQINAIASPAKGLLAYDSTVNCLKRFNGTSWNCIGNEDHDFYEITLPSTLTSSPSTNISNPIYRKGQAHFLSGAYTQDNNSFIGIKPDSSLPNGLSVQHFPQRAAVSGGASRTSQFITELTGSGAYANNLNSIYSIINQNGNANTGLSRVIEGNASLSNGTHSDIIGTHSSIYANNQTNLGTSRGIYGAVSFNGTGAGVISSESRGGEFYVLNNAASILTSNSNARAGLFGVRNNNAGNWTQTGNHIMGTHSYVENNGIMNLNGAGQHLAGAWIRNDNTATGIVTNNSGSMMGLYSTCENANLRIGAQAYGIYNQWYNNGTDSFTNEINSMTTQIKNLANKRMRANYTKSIYAATINDGIRNGVGSIGIQSDLGNWSSGATMNTSSEISNGYYQINNASGASMTSPTIRNMYAMLQNSGTMLGNANIMGLDNRIYNNSGSMSTNGLFGQYNYIYNAIGATMRDTSSIYLSYNNFDNFGKLKTQNYYGKMNAFTARRGDVNTETKIDGENVMDYNAWYIDSAANYSGGYGYSQRNYIHNYKGTMNMSGYLMTEHSYILNDGSMTCPGGIFGSYNYIQNQVGKSMSTTAAANVIADHSWIMNYGTLTTNIMQGNYSYASNRGTLNGVGIYGADIMAQNYSPGVFNNSTNGIMRGAYIHADVGSGAGLGSASVNLSSKFGLEAWSRRDGANTTETISDERALVAMVYHDALGTSNVSSAFGASLQIDHNGSGIIGTSYGCYVSNHGAGSKTNAYGIYLNDVTGTNTWGFYQSSPDRNYFSGNVGIGTTNPLNKLVVVDNSATLFAATITQNATSASGLAINASPAAGYSGLNVNASGASGGVVIVAQSPSTQGTYTAAGWAHTSDLRLKKNIVPVTSAIDIIGKLNGVYYNYSKGDYDKRQIGFIAQDVQKVLPEVVTEMYPDSTGEKMLGMVYQNIVPVLVEGIKELNTKVESKVADPNSKLIIDKLDAMQAEIKSIKESNTILQSKVDDYELYIKSCNLPCVQTLNNDPTKVAKLYQNFPNPFNSETSIEYFIPEIKNSAKLYIYALDGKELMNFEVTQSGKGFVKISAGVLAAGQYLYTLISDGVEIGTKRMILTN